MPIMTWARDREAAEGPSPWVEQDARSLQLWQRTPEPPLVAQEPSGGGSSPPKRGSRFWTSDPRALKLNAQGVHRPVYPFRTDRARWALALREPY